VRTPVLVDTSTSFDEYIKRLAKTDKKKYKKNQKETKGYTYSQIDYSPELMRHFISLWEKQVVYNSFHPKWCYSMEHMDAIKTLVMFKAVRSKTVGIHFIEKCGDYAYAHPPLYDKKTPELARFMWFGTIKWCCENDVNYLDMDGGAHRTWPDIIKARKNRRDDVFLNRVVYKWAFIPKDVKDNDLT